MMMRCTTLSSARCLVSKKASSRAAAPLHPLLRPLFPFNERHLSNYRFKSLIEWLEDEEGGKSLLLPTPPQVTPTTASRPTYHHKGHFKDPRSGLDRSFAYTDLKFQGDERKEMLETAAIEWIGGALNGLNIKNGRFEAYAIVGGSGTGKTRFLGEIVKQWDHWRDLSAAKAKADLEVPSREIPPDTLVFPIGFNFSCHMVTTEVDIIDLLLKSKQKDDVELVINTLATTRCLFACYDVKSFSTMTSHILKSLENKTLDPRALELKNFLLDINDKFYAGKEVPVLFLIDEVSKVGDKNMNLFIPAMNRMMDGGAFAIVWTTLAEGPFELAETRASQRAIRKLLLPALSPADSLTILKDTKVKKIDYIKKLKKMLSGSLYSCWNKPADRVLVDWDDVLVMLSEAAGGLPRGVEMMYLEIGKMAPGSLANESMPLMDLMRNVSKQMSFSYSFAVAIWANSLYLSVYKTSLARDETLNLNPNLTSEQVAEEAICGGCLIDARGSGNPNDKYSKIQPIIPAIFPRVFQVLEDSITSEFIPKSMENYIVDWLVLWFKARQACLYGTVDNNKVIKPILQESSTTQEELWRPFAAFLNVKNKDNYSILNDLDQKCVLKKILFSNFPLHSSDNTGVYLPGEDNYEGLDAIVVIPSKSGKWEDSVLIAIEAKNSLRERANSDVYDKLPSQYKRTVERMSKAGWTPGVNAFFYVMSKGQLDDANKKKRLLETCPHMRVLAGEELKAAMGPTIYWGFKHMRILGAVYQKKIKPKRINSE